MQEDNAIGKNNHLLFSNYWNSNNNAENVHTLIHLKTTKPTTQKWKSYVVRSVIFNASSVRDKGTTNTARDDSF